MQENDKYLGLTLDGRYEVIEKIGEGGMAVVYKAMDHRLDRYVAVKIMRDETAADEEFRRRFVAEAHAVAMLSHPNIIAVYDVSHSESIEYIVMELVDGITLRQYMNRKGQLPWEEALHFSKQIAKALSHAHARGIVHRDIKPQNVMLRRDGTIKVGDFGIAALENELGLEHDDQAVGSVHYMAPEQARGEMPDARSDIYSLGIVMYEMLTGEKPYQGETIAEIAIKHVSTTAAPPSHFNPEIPEEFEHITLKAMRADITKRYQNINNMLLDMDMFTQKLLKAEKGADLQNPEVAPIRSVSELPNSVYKRRRKKAARVTYLLGTFFALLCCVFLVRFVWSFWLNDIFSDAQRIILPDFTQMNYSQISGDASYTTVYDFNVSYVVDTEHEAGTILSQSPASGRSMMVTPEGISVDLTVSAGLALETVPNVVGQDYREAKLQLENAGFTVNIENETSDSVAENSVIRTSPVAGEQISSGTTVYITVSTGQSLVYVTVPNLVGLSESAAVTRLENAGFVYGGIERKVSDYDAGTVIGQSITAFTQAEEHTSIYLTVSAGPEG